MKTFKLLLVATLILVGVNLNAQDKPFTFGVKAGANMSTMTGDIEDSKVKLGFNIGVTVDYAINQDWYILSGLQYTTKGVKIEYNFADEDYKSTINAAYLQLPIHVGYKLEIAPETKLVFHAGPYLAYGVNGKIKESGTEVINDTAIPYSVKVNTFDFMKRFDAGLGLGVGAEFGKFGVDLGWDFGLVNVVKEGNNTNRNGNAYLTVGYKF